jgi:hypothetical protein
VGENVQLLHIDVRTTQDDVRLMRRELQALRRQFDPSFLIDVDNPQQASAPHTVTIPQGIQDELERLFALHDTDQDLADCRGPLLREMADAFVRNFGIASPLFEPNESLVDEAGGTGKQYIALLTCQFLMTKMLGADEILRAPEVSHWPRYVQSLQQVRKPHGRLAEPCLVSAVTLR